MTDKKQDGGQAFPSPVENYGKGTECAVRGMTLRDYFAGKALQGMLASWPEEDKFTTNNSAEMAYRFADAMLSAREK